MAIPFLFASNTLYLEELVLLQKEVYIAHLFWDVYSCLRMRLRELRIATYIMRSHLTDIN